MKRTGVTFLLLAAIVVTVVVSLWIGQAVQGSGEESFGGTDAQVTEVLDEQGVQPWFSPIFQPESSELESGLFALQAALGGIVLGYCIGRLQGRRRSEAEPAQTAAGRRPGSGSTSGTSV